MNTVNQEEVHKFSHRNWWNHDAPESKMLHKMNVLRMKFLLSLCKINGKSILDIGCGGGIASESLTRCGGSVTGIDASTDAITCAEEHAKTQGLKIDYRNVPIEEFKSDIQFDLVLANDIIEHVENPMDFLAISGKFVKRNGLFVISTINKNPLSLLFAKGMAEYVLRVVPKGTHEFSKFLSPQTIKNALANNFSHIKTQGFSYNPLTKECFFEPTALVNYFIVFQKTAN